MSVVDFTYSQSPAVKIRQWAWRDRPAESLLIAATAAGAAVACGWVFVEWLPRSAAWIALALSTQRLWRVECFTISRAGVTRQSGGRRGGSGGGGGGGSGGKRQLLPAHHFRRHPGGVVLYFTPADGLLGALRSVYLSAPRDNPASLITALNQAGVAEGK